MLKSSTRIFIEFKKYFLADMKIQKYFTIVSCWKKKYILCIRNVEKYFEWISNVKLYIEKILQNVIFIVTM